MKEGKVALGDLARVRTGKLDANASSPNGKYPFFTCAIKPLRIDSYGYECECVLVAGNGDLNVKYHNGRFDAYQRTYIVEPISKSLDCRYLYYFLDSYLAELRKLSIGGVIKYIKLGNLTDAQIPLPPPEEQQRIAAILDKASAIRSCSEKAARNAADIKASLFDEAFIAHDRHGLWERIALGELCDVQGGLQVTSARSAMPIRVPYLRVANVLRGRLDLAEIKEINCSQPELDRTRLQPKDLLVVEGHGNPNEIGRVAMWTEQPGEMVHQNHLIRVRSKASSMDPEFLCFYLNSRMGRRHLLKRANTTSGLNTISTSVVKSAPIIVPPIDEQRSFCEAIRNIARLEASLLVGSALHAQLSRSLLSESFDK
jgi:type I restriction enzyme S subunit